MYLFKLYATRAQNAPSPLHLHKLMGLGNRVLSRFASLKDSSTRTHRNSIGTRDRHARMAPRNRRAKHLSANCVLLYQALGAGKQRRIRPGLSPDILKWFDASPCRVGRNAVGGVLPPAPRIRVFGIVPYHPGGQDGAACPVARSTGSRAINPADARRPRQGIARARCGKRLPRLSSDVQTARRQAGPAGSCTQANQGMGRMRIAASRSLAPSPTH